MQRENEDQKRVEIFGFENLTFFAQILLLDWFRQVRKEEPDFDVLLASTRSSAGNIDPDNHILMSVAEKIGADLAANKQLYEIILKAAQQELTELGQ